MRLPARGATKRQDPDAVAGADDHDVVDLDADPVGLNRRSFLARGGAAAAMLGLVASVPGGTAILTAVESNAPEIDSDATQTAGLDAPAMTAPVVAHVTDLASGEISIFSGESEVVIRNQQLAAQLVRAAR